jgi:hypothetical protein
VNAVVLGLVTFICTFTAALIATLIRGRLPAPHLSKESQDVVRLGIGLVATMTALLLGLVTAAARSTFDAQDVAIRTSGAAILTLDRHLARYGPETQRTRDLIRQAVAARLEEIWHLSGGLHALHAAGGAPPIEEIENQILALTPQHDNQRWFKSEALKLSQEIVKARWRVLESGTGSVPIPFLVVVIFWLTATFASFGLYAPRNATVVAVLFVAAVSVAAAVFLVLELDGPLDGFIKVSSKPMEYVLSQLGH